MTDETKHTPGEWKYGVRKDKSMWLSLGNPSKGPHYQGDFVGREADAKLVCAAPSMLADLIEAERMFRWYGDLHAAKPDAEKAMRNYAMADRLSDTIAKAIGDVE